MKFLKATFLISFVLFSLGDIITTLLIKYKFPVFNEAFPLYVIGVSIWVVIALKLFIVSYLGYFLLKKYNTVKFTFMRYLLVYFLVFFVLMNLAVCVNNYRYYQLSPEQVVPISDERKLEFYREAVIEGKVIYNIAPQNEDGINIPILYFIFFFNMIQFLVWRSFEKDEK